MRFPSKNALASGETGTLVTMAVALLLPDTDTVCSAGAAVVDSDATAVSKCSQHALALVLTLALVVASCSA